jgi:hypothetical protein
MPSHYADLYPARKAAANGDRGSSDFYQDWTTPRSRTPHSQLFTDEDAKLGQGAHYTASLWHLDNLQASPTRCSIQARHRQLASGRCFDSWFHGHPDHLKLIFIFMVTLTKQCRCDISHKAAASRGMPGGEP